MTEEQENKELCSDDEWQQVLDVTKRLWEVGDFHFVFHPLVGMPVLSVDETALPQYLADTSIDAETFKSIFRAEVGPLLYPIVSGMSDEELVGEDSPFSKLPEEQETKLFERRGQLAQGLGADRLCREFDTKMNAATEVLAGIEAQLFRAADTDAKDASTSPVAVLTISGDVPVAGVGMSLLLRGFFDSFTGARGRESIALTCTRNDIQYLRRRLEEIERDLIELEE